MGLIAQTLKTILVAGGILLRTCKRFGFVAWAGYFAAWISGSCIRFDVIAAGIK